MMNGFLPLCQRCRFVNNVERHLLVYSECHQGQSLCVAQYTFKACCLHCTNEFFIFAVFVTAFMLDMTRMAEYILQKNSREYKSFVQIGLNIKRCEQHGVSVYFLFIVCRSIRFIIRYLLKFIYFTQFSSNSTLNIVCLMTCVLFSFSSDRFPSKN